MLGTQNWTQSQADPFLAHKIAIFVEYLYLDIYLDIIQIIKKLSCAPALRRNFNDVT